MKSVADLKIDYQTGHFDCSLSHLTSLKGSPPIVEGAFMCYSNNLVSLEGAPHTMSVLTCSDNNIESLKDIHKHIRKMNGVFHAYNCPLRSHVLGLLLIEGITRVSIDNRFVADIINRHLGKGRAGMLMAQEELIEAGLEEFAQL